MVESPRRQNKSPSSFPVSCTSENPPSSYSEEWCLLEEGWEWRRGRCLHPRGTVCSKWKGRRWGGGRSSLLLRQCTSQEHTGPFCFNYSGWLPAQEKSESRSPYNTQTFPPKGKKTNSPPFVRKFILISLLNALISAAVAVFNRACRSRLTFRNISVCLWYNSPIIYD